MEKYHSFSSVSAFILMAEKPGVKIVFCGQHSSIYPIMVYSIVTKVLSLYNIDDVPGRLDIPDWVGVPHYLRHHGKVSRSLPSSQGQVSLHLRKSQALRASYCFVFYW